MLNLLLPKCHNLPETGFPTIRERHKISLDFPSEGKRSTNNTSTVNSNFQPWGSKYKNIVGKAVKCPSTLLKSSGIISAKLNLMSAIAFDLDD